MEQPSIWDYYLLQYRSGRRDTS